MQENDLAIVISKFMTSRTAKQIIAILILPNPSRSKANHKMNFGQLIEYNTRNIFLEKSYAKCGVETSPRPFSKKIKIEHIYRSTI